MLKFALADCDFGNYWLTSGGSTKVFIDYLKDSDYNLEEIEEEWVDESTLGRPYSHEDPIPLLFQTGYLTVTDYDDRLKAE